MDEFQTIIENEYARAREEKSDINEHLPVLRRLAGAVGSVTEFGARAGASSRAFLAAALPPCRLRSYDLTLHPPLQNLFARAKDAGRDVAYLQGDTRALDIEQTDMLFIDTLHSYAQMSEELKRHAAKVNRYIAFHDAVTFGLRDETYSRRKTRAQKLAADVLTLGAFKIIRTIRKQHARKYAEIPRSENAGVLNAILHFLAASDEWKIREHYTNNNGLLVIERIAPAPRRQPQGR